MPDVLMFTETWLKPKTNDAKMGLKQFYIFRLDRHDSPNNCVYGGGVLLAVNRKFKSRLFEKKRLSLSLLLYTCLLIQALLNTADSSSPLRISPHVTLTISSWLVDTSSCIMSAGLRIPSSTNSVPTSHRT